MGKRKYGCILLNTVKTDGQQARNLEKATKIYKDYEDFIRETIVKQDPVNAEDLFHDFFLFISSKPIPDHIENVKGYIYRALQNDLLDFFRYNANYNARLRRYALKHQPEPSNNDPQEITALKNTAEYVFAIANQKLPAYLARVFRLCFKDQHSIHEISEIIGVPPRSVSVYVCNALKQVRKHLKEADEEGINF